jgi:hypothetical protein
VNKVLLERTKLSSMSSTTFAGFTTCPCRCMMQKNDQVFNNRESDRERERERITELFWSGLNLFLFQES